MNAQGRSRGAEPSKQRDMPAIETLRAIDPEAARRLLDPAYFDARFYVSQRKLDAKADVFADYFRMGAAQGLRPNVVFDAGWYIEQNADVVRAGVNPLLHYVVIGEPERRDPSPLFDTRWYAETHGVDAPLRHYLANRFGAFSPIPEFDAGYYLAQYPDVAAAKLDPFLHYMHFGYREFRQPSADFNARRYANRWLADNPGANPILDLRRRRPPVDEDAQPTAFDFVRAHSRPGRDFETFAPPTPRTPQARLLAFHLTQFHRTPENDAWWGEGFSEWTLLSRGQPRFAGHYQPRAPGALGFYDLTQSDALRAQVRLAKAAGITGFVFYYYNFGGRRLLERPLEAFLAAPEADISFCLMWANENWTRRWDGAEQEVLVAQSYSEADEEARCDDLARHFRDTRYLRLSGRPLLMVYRASLIPEAAAAVARWRRLFVERHGEEPIFVMAQTFADLDPRPLGFDAAVEFPPHKLTKTLPQAYERMRVFDVGVEADVFAYDDVAAGSLAEPEPPFPLIKTVVPSWDNDARRQGRGLTLAGATPLKYERWLVALVARARAKPIFGEAIVCVNAWNEWSEGAYLEPDVHFGAAYLNATARVAFGAPKAGLKIAFAASGARFAGLSRYFRVAFGVDAEEADVSNAAVALIGPGGEGALERLAATGARLLYLPDGEGAAPHALARADVVVFGSKNEQQRARSSFPSWNDANAVVLPSHDEEIWGRALFSLAFPKLAKISAIVVTRRTDEPLAARLASVFAQTHPLWEVIVLETAGAADSLTTVSACAREADRDAIVLDARAEEITAAWVRAVEAASGDLVWIADADGVSDPEFVGRVARAIASAPVVAAFCDAALLRTDGVPPRAPSLLSPRRTPSVVDERFDSARFARLLGRGVDMPTVSAALWRRDVFARLLKETGPPQLGESAAPLLRAAVTASQAKLGYVAETLEFSSAPLARG